MRFKIPRYIDYEAKIFGPASFKQFLFLLAGMILVGFVYLIVDSFFIFFILAMIIGSITGALAFGKINGQPLITMIGKYISFTLSGSKTYFWKKKELHPKTIKRKEIEEKEEENDDNILPTTQRRGKLDKISKKIETY